jgi:dihydropteroate synthase
MINDVSGLLDPGLVEICAIHGAGLVIMHTRTPPKTKVVLSYDDVVADVALFLGEKMDLAVAGGLLPENVVLDPGPDFAKTPAQTVETLRGLAQLTALGRPLLLAVSRKDFVGALTRRKPRDRLAGTLAAVAEGLDSGSSILRVHDVAAVQDFLLVRAALRGWTPVPDDLAVPEHLRRQRGPREPAPR